jgi:hypothetical protein
MSAEQTERDHPSAGVLAAFVDGTLPLAERAAIESHLADCDDCRAGVIAAVRFARPRVSVRRWYLPAAAAAAVLLVTAIGRERAPNVTREPVMREPVISTTEAPVALAPRGLVSRPVRLVWTTVAFADRYRVTLFDDAGRAIYETQTRDTSAVVPDSIHLELRQPYFWKMEAQTGWNRWVASELIEFSVGPAVP